jgi:hypothetical protein
VNARCRPTHDCYFDTIADVSASNKIAKASDSRSVELSDSEKVIVETGGVVLGGFFGLCLAGPLGAVVGAFAGQVLTPASERLIGKCLDELRGRGRVVAEAASLTSGLAEEEILDRLLESDELQPLVARILDAASRTNATETLRLLGYVLGESVSNRPRKIDEDLLLVDILTGLEPGHLRVLELFESPADPSNPDVNWGVENITATMADDMSAVGSQAAIGGLLARGLIQTMSGFGGGGNQITELGRALLSAVRQSRR